MHQDRVASLVRGAALLLSSDRSLPDVLDGARELLEQYIDAGILLVFVHDDDGSLRCKYASMAGAAGKPDHEFVAHPDSRAVKTLTTGEPMLLSRASEWKVQRLVTIRGFSRSPASAIFVPIAHRERRIGVLTVQSGNEDAYRHRDIALVETCAMYIAVKIAEDPTF